MRTLRERNKSRVVCNASSAPATSSDGVAERVRLHRQKLKEDLLKYEEVKERDRLFKQKEKKMKRELLFSNKRLLDKYRVDKREEMKKIYG